MDAMDVLTNLEHLQPFFQPIFSADEHIVIGYEVLGRYVYEETIHSLGPFFLDDSIPEEYRIDVDNIILGVALERLRDRTDKDSLIFINRDPNLLMIDHGEKLLNILKGKLGEDQLHRIVLELSANKFSGETKSLCHLLNYYRTYGIKIAVDHLGRDTQLDSVTALSPNILKVNLDTLSYKAWDTHKDMVDSLGLLARKIGAVLLFEGIESVYQLQYAWNNGGRYYQGFYLAEPRPEFMRRDELKERFKQECHSFIVSEKKTLERKFRKKEALKESIEEIVQKLKPASNDIPMLKVLGKNLGQFAFRLYICDEDGFQTSPNIVREDGDWRAREEYINKNWSWRPYFLKTIIKMRNSQQGQLSDPYSDIETGDTIRTFSIPLNEGEYLFVDISYDYLFEHDIF